MKIRRDIIDRLRQWKNSENRKPILLKGARQTGKTWIMQEFGKEKKFLIFVILEQDQKKIF